MKGTYLDGISMASIQRQKMKVLVIDDNLINLKVAERMIQEMGTPVLMNSGEKALAYLKDYSVDLILLDVMMPEMNGFETMEHMNALAIEAPVYFLTADEDENIMEKGEALGVKGIIAKPINRQRFMEVVESIRKGRDE